MIVFPNCKINLGLNIVRKRDDGYHDLETVFYPLGLRDALEIIADATSSFSISGLTVAGSVDNNLCLKAYDILKKDFPSLPAVKTHLHKCIPIGAGLGGGSADAAFMLLLLNRKFDLKLSENSLIDYALRLGSDCPFFIKNKPVFATGRGEVMKDVSLDLSAYKFLVVNPGIHISTKEAFAKLLPKSPKKSIYEIIQQSPETWKEELINDFEKPVTDSYPEIFEVKNEMYSMGAVYASMSGSGSSTFGIFAKEKILRYSYPSHYLIKEIDAT